MPPLLADATKPVPIWMCLGILEVGEGRMREEEVLKADGSSICNVICCLMQLEEVKKNCAAETCMQIRDLTRLMSNIILG